MLRSRGIGSRTRVGRPVEARPDEAALVRRIACGDVNAFDALFRRYAPRLLRFLGRAPRGGHMSDEIVNDTMLVVWRKAATFNGCSRVSTWILGIASRRRMKALQSIKDAEVAVDLDAIAGPAELGPEEQLLRKDLQRRLDRAIAALPPEQREVVLLTYVEGCSYAQIARIAGCPVNTVKTRMFHARRRLATLLADQRGAA